MHLFSPAVGLKSYDSRPAMDKLIKGIIDEAIRDNRVIYSFDERSQDGFFEAQINKSLVKYGKNDVAGISVRGIYNPETKDFLQTFYFPYVEGEEPYFNLELFMERQNDREAYMVHCSETKKEVAPIFFLRNIVEYLNHFDGIKTINERMVFLSALATEGKVIFPVQKTKEQIERCKAALKERGKLINRALNGDKEAMDSLTIGDDDVLSNVCRRIKKEDVYSVVDSSFIPSGLECDAYSVVGNILDVNSLTNEVSGEEIYYMLVECNDYEFSLAINKEDLFGLPQPGFRFVGKIWLQGSIFID